MCMMVLPWLLKLPSVASSADLGQSGVGLPGFPQRELRKRGAAEAGVVTPEDACARE